MIARTTPDSTPPPVQPSVPPSAAAQPPAPAPKCATLGAGTLTNKEHDQEKRSVSGSTETPNTKHKTLPAPPPLCPSASPPTAARPSSALTPTSSSNAYSPPCVPDFKAIPEALRQADRWLVWRYEQTPDGRRQKGFFRPGRGRAIYDDFRSWTSFPDAQAAYERSRHVAHPYDGIAFALGDAFAAIELNDVLTEAPPPPLSPSAPATEHGQHALTERRAVAEQPKEPDSAPRKWIAGSPPSVSAGSTSVTRYPTLTPSSSSQSSPVPTLCLCDSVVNPGFQPSLLPWAQKLVDDLATYTELAPDGRSLTLICCGLSTGAFDLPTLDPVPHPEGGTFAYHRIRHVCITGRPGPLHSGHAVEDRATRLQQIVRQLHQGTKLETLFPGAPPPAPPHPGTGREAGAAGPAVSRDADRAIRAINPFAGLPTMQEIRAKRKAERVNRPAHGPINPNEDRSRWMTEEDYRAMWADNRRKARRRRDPELGPPPSADELVELAFTRFRLCRTPAGEPFAVERAGPNIARFFRGGADPFRATLVRHACRELGRAPKPIAVGAALALLQAEALDAPIETISLRVASLPAGVPLAIADAPPSPERRGVSPTCPQEQEAHNASGDAETPNTKHETLPADSREAHPPSLCLSVPPSSTAIAVDLGRPDGRAVLITPSGWTVVDRSPVLFRRTALTGELPIPERGARLDAIRSLVNVTDDAWTQLRGWLVAALFPSIAHPILLLGGVQGTGKSSAMTLLCDLVDPSTAPLRSEPRDPDAWSHMAAGGWCIPLDNISSISPWFSDAMCKAVTGDGFVRRKLNTDGDLTVLKFRRVIALTSIDPGALRGDLADRLLLVEFERIPDHLRQPETLLLENFERLKPQIFGALLDEVASVLRRLPEVRLTHLPRMADFARILAALDLSHASGVPRATGSAGALKIEEQEEAPQNALGPVSGSVSALAPTSNSSSSSLSSGNQVADANPIADANADANTLADAADANSLAIYFNQNHRLAAEVIDGDPVGLAISELVPAGGTWEGTAAELLSAFASKPGRGPALTPRTLSGKLKRLAPALGATGIAVDFYRENDRLRTRRIRLSSTSTDGIG